MRCRDGCSGSSVQIRREPSAGYVDTIARFWIAFVLCKGRRTLIRTASGPRIAFREILRTRPRFSWGGTYCVVASCVRSGFICGLKVSAATKASRKYSRQHSIRTLYLYLCRAARPSQAVSSRPSVDTDSSVLPQAHVNELAILLLALIFGPYSTNTQGTSVSANPMPPRRLLAAWNPRFVNS